MREKRRSVRSFYSLESLTDLCFLAPATIMERADGEGAQGVKEEGAQEFVSTSKKTVIHRE